METFRKDNRGIDLNKRRPHVLVILDGFGYRKEKEANAIKNAQTPTFDHLLNSYPHTLIHTSGKHVGLPAGQMGNSEVGHMNLGAGRVVYQNFTRISKAIEEGDFFENQALCNSVDQAIKNNKTLHIIGLLSPGGVHSHEEHFSAMIKLAQQRGAKKVMVHAFLDGRDMPPRSAEASLVKIDQQLKDAGIGHIASLIGRYYAMDRDNRWNRIEEAYNLLTLGRAQFHAADAISGLKAAYQRDENDEFVRATLIKTDSESIEDITLQDGDALIFMNFRADRGRELSQVFTKKSAQFKREKIPALSSFTTLTQYAQDIESQVAFPPTTLTNVLGEYLSKAQKTQLRLAETEKYAHVTFFFSGGREAVFEGEERILINSPNVATYDLQPEMSAKELTDELVKAINNGHHDFIVCNYANGDMVGHTGNYPAAVKAIETLDTCLKRIEQAILENQGECLITADHGNAEKMVDDQTGQPFTSHTNGPVPLIYIGKPATLIENGALSDIAPTLLHLMGMEIPEEMSGHSLVQYQP
ncbi:MAG: 2,3-bisphosphoglycerate-independent phosphoglycerate mutase [Pseudomonadales bacterium]|nr:2,3-bisphosphoglycerate-independent phosphoglycerate mutase [Pseudomonadales bacterium]